MEAASKKSEDQRVKKPAPPQIQSKGAEQALAGYETKPVAGHSLNQLPSGPGARGLRQAAVLQMQKTRGNTFVMRQMAQREDAPAPVETPAPAPTEAPASAPAAEGTTPSSISDGSATVSADGGNVGITGAMVNISGGVVNMDAAMVSASGVLRASTIVADNVVASSYTPGAGNLW